jgi:hypothetical protein
VLRINVGAGGVISRPFLLGGIVAIWIVLHEYPEGASPYLVRSGGKPTQKQAKKIVDGFKQRADNSIRIVGPYNEKYITDLTKKKRKRSPAKEEPDIETFPLTGTKCSICKEPQYQTPSGATCRNSGHGGAPPLEEEEEVDDLDPFIQGIMNRDGDEAEEDFDPYDD